jgi:hypothetical protein
LLTKYVELAAGPLGSAVVFLCSGKKKLFRGGFGFLRGFLRKVDVLVWCFCGVKMVFCVVDVEFKQRLFRLLKM